MYRFLFLFVLMSSAQVLFGQSLRAVSGLYTDAVYVPQTGKIYATTLSSSPENGNSLCRIDPETGNVEACFFVGSSPSVVAATDNGAFLYLGFSGETSVKRFDLATNTIDMTFSMGGEGDFLGPFYAGDILPLAGSEENIAVEKENACCSPSHEGIFIFRNGIQQSDNTPDHTGSNTITYTDVPDQIIGYNNSSTEFGLRQMSITSSGVSVTNVYQFFTGFGNKIEYAGGRVYNTNGQFVNINNGVATSGGVFSNNSFSFDRLGVEAIPSIERVFYFGRGDSGQYIIESFNQTTLTSQDIWTFPSSQTGSIREFAALDQTGERFLAVDDNNTLLLLRICTSTLTETPPAYVGPNRICGNDTLFVVAPEAAQSQGEIVWSDGSVGDTLRLVNGGTYSYAILDPSGCPGPLSPSFHISRSYTIPDPPILGTPLSSVICQDGSLTLSTEFVSASSFIIWNTGDTTNALTVQDAGSYSARLVNSQGCQSAFSAPLVITASDSVAPPAPNLFPTPELDTCTTERVLISTDGTAPEYFWNIQNGSSFLTTGNLEVLFSFSPTYYQVQAISANGCVSEAASGRISFFLPPPTPFIQYNEASNLLASNFTGGRNFWYLNDELIEITDGRFYEPMANGFYSVRSEGEACLSEASQLFSVVITSVQEMARLSNQVSLAPNPAGETVRINLPAAYLSSRGNLTTELNLWTLTGRKISTTQVENDFQPELDLSGLRSGAYLITIHRPGTPIIRKRLIKM